MVLKQQFIFFFHCANFNSQRKTLFDKIATTAANIFTENEDSIVYTLLSGCIVDTLLFGNQIVKIPSIETLNASIEYILLTERYNNPLF